jgi:Prealbumin-like fold domain
LTGTASNGHSVTESAVTDADGLYMFDNLPAGTYAISETPPTGYTNGLTTIGSVSGTVQTGKISNIHLGAGVDDTGNDFGMQQTVGSPLAANQTGSIAFWNGSSGQALIKALNGGPSATALSNYLASTFPDIYGKSAGANNLTGKTNAQVASFYQQLYNESGPKLDAETLALALSTYVTKSSLAGNTATSYGFAVTANGSATATFNVGTNGAAFGVDDNTTLTIMDLLTLTDAQAHKGLLWDLNGDGSLSTGETMLRLEADELFDAINSY